MRQIIFICCLIAVISCADKKTKTATATVSPMENVMDVHDALMPKMGTIRSLEEQLKDQPDSIKTPMLKELKDANQAMMLWMEGLGNDFETEELMMRKELSPEKLAVLETYTKSVSALKEQMEGAITKAKKVVEGAE